MNRSNYLILLRQKLKPLHGAGETDAIARILLDHLTRKYNLPTDTQCEWDFSLIAEACGLLDELLAGRPIQYVLNEAWFDNRAFFVNESVLIPRPETEELLDWIKHTYATQSHPDTLLDIGTGSGILAISLKRAFPSCTVTAVDKSKKALEIANKNAHQHQETIPFVEMDFIDAHSQASLPNYDLIVSNPPYIPLEEKSTMPALVIEHEPHLALFTPNEDPLLFYRSIAAFGHHHLNENGHIFVELHEDRAEQTQRLFEELSYQTELKKDMQGKWRMLHANRA